MMGIPQTDAGPQAEKSATELVIRIDLADMLKDMPTHVVEREPVIPNGYRCQDCWRDDGKHEVACCFYGGVSGDRS